MDHEDLDRRMRLAPLSATPDWSEILPKEATRNADDHPITNTKVAAVIQGRRVSRRGGWWVTLQSVEEWREKYSPRLEVLVEQIETWKSLQQATKAARPYFDEMKECPNNVMEANAYLAGANVAEMIEEMELEAAMIKRGMNLN